MNGTGSRSSPRDRLTRPIALATAGGLIAVVVLTGWARRHGGPGSGPALGDPGELVQASTTAARLIVDVCATMTVGSAAFAMLCTSPQVSDQFGTVLSRRGFEAMSRCSRWSRRWALMCVFSVFLTAVADAGLRFSSVGGPAAWIRLAQIQQESGYWLASAVGAAALAICARFTVLWRTTGPLVALGLVAVLPPLFIGHASSETGHDYATAAVALHVPAAVVWVGLLIQVAGDMAHRGRLEPGLLRRYSRVAWLCWTIVGGSGLVLAGVFDPQHRLGSIYVLGVIVKVVLFVVLGGVAWVWRGRQIERIADRSVSRSDVDWVSACRLIGVETAVLAVAFVVSAQLTSLVPPMFELPSSIYDTLLGYDLAGPPSVARLALDWRVEILFTVVALVLLGWYLALHRRLRESGGVWPPGRTAAWICGCALLVVATSSGLGRYEPAMFSVHMASHMLVSTAVPTLLALGGPLTLARSAGTPRTTEDSRGRNPFSLPGASDWLGIVEDSRATRLLTHPVVSLTLFVGLPFLVYFGGVFDRAARFHWAHLALAGVFLVSGYGFAWAVIGVDRTPRPMPSLARLGMLLAAVPFTALFAGLLVSSHQIVGNGAAGGNAYSALDLPWMRDLLADQRLGGLVGLAICEAVVLASMVSLLVRWWDLDEPVFLPVSRPDLPEPQAVGDHEQR